MAAPRRPSSRRPPTGPQLAWLSRGVDQPGGKLPLFDAEGQEVKPQLVKSCLKAGWAEHWFDNPLKPDWLVCRLTDRGRQAVLDHAAAAEDARQGELI